MEQIVPLKAPERTTEGTDIHTFVLTEYGVVMVANILNSGRAIAMSVQVVREFILLRSIARSQDPIKKKRAQLERAVNVRLDTHEDQIDELFDAEAQPSQLQLSTQSEVAGG